MDPLYGVGGSCASTDQVRNVPRRDSSISLDDVAYKRCVSEPTKSPLAPLELQCLEEPRETTIGHECSLPAPSTMSSSSVIAPMEVYLQCDESHESRMMRLGGTVLDQGKQTSEPREISPSPETSSWEIVNYPIPPGQQMPSSPMLQPTLNSKATDVRPTKTTDSKVELEDLLSVCSDSEMSELSLPVALRAGSDSTSVYKRVVAECKAAKRSKYVLPALELVYELTVYRSATGKTPDMKARIYKGKRKRKFGKEKETGEVERG
ncbi:hypothetical protein KAF25_001461 [Fusarium avenaceum]|uniref:Uncharacterized protein n=1 Tax=Fusarium avenaceum TaxID=40199 RepID=A0A9P7KW82_9HYPO|nr:hypothetical protein KAF25_001461 [Fusarium avenaceum]